MKIIIIGFMGSGKSAVSKELAKKLNLQVLEMDDEVYKKTGTKNMKEVFAKGGEILLREWEIALAKEWRNIDNVVISTGGGVVLNKIIIDYFKINDGIIIFLKAAFKEIEKRVIEQSIERPLFKNTVEARKLYNFRLPLYKNYADIIINTEKKSVMQIVEEIMKLNLP